MPKPKSVKLGDAEKNMGQDAVTAFQFLSLNVLSNVFQCTV